MIPAIRWHFCLSFIKHYWNATRIDVLHSPFVFSLYNRSIKRKSNPLFHKADELVAKIKKNNAVVQQIDFGKSTPVVHSKSVSELATLQAKPKRIITILSQLILELNCKTGIELGTSLGISACYQGLAFQENGGKLITIEGSPELAKLAQQHIELIHLGETVKVLTGNFDLVLPVVIAEHEQLDYVFIDGNHRYEPTMNYFNMLLPKMHNNSVLVFDDIYWSKGMTQAWEEIKNHPQVTVTIDLFFIGLVFFRKEQAKEHFRLRIL